jgi:pimeloyl-ACP methyl ester carboxylesterase
MEQEIEGLMASQKSTNVRITTSALRLGLRLVDALSTKWAGEVGRRLFLSAPPRRKTSASEAAILARGERLTVESNGERLAVWRFGHGPRVLLAHGWGGSGAQLSRFVDPLLAAGFSVIAFDGVGHGSASGSSTSLVHLAQSILDVVDAVGPLHGAITHSVGGAALSIAMARGLPLERAVFISPPADALVWFERFSHELALPERVKNAVRHSIEETVGVPFADLNAIAMAPRTAMELLVIHDRKDREVPFSEGVVVARAAGGRMVATEGLGHRRIVLDPEVVATSLRFFAPERPTLQALIDRELFDPSQRAVV